MKRPDFDIVVLGAGGAGLMAAASAGRIGASVLVIEHNAQPGRKILISGGGRCNFTNLDCEPTRYLSANPHFAKSALSRYPSSAFIELVDRYDIAWHEKTLGQLFCDGSAGQIVNMLMTEAQEAGCSFRFGESVESVEQGGEQFALGVGDDRLTANSIIVATGGPSIPKLGATDFGFRLAKQFGLKLVEPRPALVPLTLPPEQALFKQLSGVSMPVLAAAGDGRFSEAALFTHKGLSGPAILQISSYWIPGEPVWIDFCPDQPSGWLADRKRRTPKISFRSMLSEDLPSRLAEVLSESLSEQEARTAEAPLSAFSDKALLAIETRLAAYMFHPNGTEGYAKAEVTSGGVSTSELSSKTLEAKRVPGLYFIGECVDVTGWLGGYNFQWAWASGVAAGEAAGVRKG